MQDLIKEFMAQEKFAVVGATDNPDKYGLYSLKRPAKSTPARD